MTHRKNTIATVFAGAAIATVASAAVITSSLAAIKRAPHPRTHASQSYNAWGSTRPRFELNQWSGGARTEQGRSDVWGHWGAYYGPMIHAP